MWRQCSILSLVALALGGCLQHPATKIEPTPIGSQTAPGQTEGGSLAKLLRYTPPPNYVTSDLTYRESALKLIPFDLYGPGFTVGAAKDESGIFFQIGPVGYSIGEDKVLEYQHVGTTELKNLLREKIRARLKISPLVTLEKVNGLKTANWVGPSGQSCVRWIQIETNAVLQITVAATNANTFATLTNSLRTLVINKKQLLDLLRRERPPLAEARLDKVEAGYMNWRGRRTAVLVFRCKDSMFCFAGADGFTAEESLNRCLGPLAEMRDLSGQRGMARIALVRSLRIDYGPDAYQSWLNFFTETNSITVAQVKQGEYYGPGFLMLWESWTNREPQAFEIVGEYKVKATLLMQKER